MSLTKMGSENAGRTPGSTNGTHVSLLCRLGVIIPLGLGCLDSADEQGLVLETWVGLAVGCVGSPVSTRGTAGFEGVPSACCICPKKLLACGEEGWAVRECIGAHLVT